MEKPKIGQVVRIETGAQFAQGRVEQVNGDFVTLYAAAAFMITVQITNQSRITHIKQ